MLASTEVALIERSEINRENSRERCDQGSRSFWIMIQSARPHTRFSHLVHLAPLDEK
jgi:hypothetical protein